MGRRQRSSGGEGGEGGHDGGGSLRWVLTYADMITLLMAFFIMLYSMSILNLIKFRQVAVSIRSGFGGLVEGQGRSVLGTSGQFSIKPSPIPGDTVGVPWTAVQKIQRMIKEPELGKAVRLRTDRRGLIISMVPDKLAFEKGQAELTPTARTVLRRIEGILRATQNQIQVEGHTCDLPVVSNKYPSNWELSTARATSVVRFLIEETDMPSARLSAAGYADSKPLVPNTSEKNRSLNRRVDIVVLKIGY